MKKSKSKIIDNLRRQAEDLLDKEPGAIRSMPPQDVRKLVSELNIHQIELEMQNEELRQALEELEESRKRYSNLYDFAPVGYFTLNKNGLIEEVNLTGAQMLGRERRYLTQKGFSRFIASNSQDIFFSHRKQIFKSRERQTCQLELIKYDDTKFYAQLESTAVRDDEGNLSYFRMAIIDITDLKRAKKLIQRKNQIESIINEILNLSLESGSLEKILEDALEKIILIDWLKLKSQGSIFLVGENSDELELKVSRKFPEKLKNICSHVSIGKCLCGLAAFKKEILFAGHLDACHENRYAGMPPHAHYCVPILLEDKILGVLNLYVEVNHQRNQDEENSLMALANVLGEIIKRKQAEEELDKHRRHLEEMVVERTTKLNLANTQLKKEISERKQAEEELKTRQKEIEAINASLENRVQEELEKSRQKDFIMMQQSRLAAMGELIGHIAHQWKQPLNAINILLFNIQDGLEEPELNKEKLYPLFQKGEKLIKKMSKTIDDFRYFFKPDKEKELFSINKHITSTLSMVEANLKHHNISLVINDREKITIFGFPNEYSQVILNIVSNAADAIIAKGVNGKIVIDVFHEEAFAVVAIKDNGGGIPEEIINHIFDPYFTTKKEGKGTGIGLYMSKLIIEDHMNGRIEVKNIDDGAEFKILIPHHPRHASEK